MWVQDGMLKGLEASRVTGVMWPCLHPIKEYVVFFEIVQETNRGPCIFRLPMN